MPAVDCLTPSGRRYFDAAFRAVDWAALFPQAMEMMMSKHDVTQSSNPDVQALLVVITGLAQRVERAEAVANAAQAAFDALPTQFLIPPPNGAAVPYGVQGKGTTVLAGSDGAGGGGGGEANLTVLGIPVKSVAEAEAVAGVVVKPAKVKTVKAVG